MLEESIKVITKPINMKVTMIPSKMFQPELKDAQRSGIILSNNSAV